MGRCLSILPKKIEWPAECEGGWKRKPLVCWWSISLRMPCEGGWESGRKMDSHVEPRVDWGIDVPAALLRANQSRPTCHHWLPFCTRTSQSQLIVPYRPNCRSRLVHFSCRLSGSGWTSVHCPLHKYTFDVWLVAILKSNFGCCERGTYICVLFMVQPSNTVCTHWQSSQRRVLPWWPQLIFLPLAFSLPLFMPALISESCSIEATVDAVFLMHEPILKTTERAMSLILIHVDALNSLSVLK